jgi:hypothetical protein
MSVDILTDLVIDRPAPIVFDYVADPDNAHIRASTWGR